VAKAQEQFGNPEEGETYAFVSGYQKTGKDTVEWEDIGLCCTEPQTV
jgi:hypothetical protein